MKGNHIPLFEGESKEEAVKNFLENKNKQEQRKDNENGKGKESESSNEEREKTRKRESLVRRIRERLDSGRYEAFISEPYTGGSEVGLGDGLVKEKITLSEDLMDDFKEAKLTHTPMYRLENSEKAGEFFASKLTEAKESLGEKGSSVYVYPPEEYKEMKLFLSKDGNAGFAVKKDGDIVSVFSREKGLSTYMLQMAISNGGEKLDCFDTYLPKIYKANGFVEYDRDKWNEEYKPEGWNKEFYKEFNNGEPDVIYMKIKKKNENDYKKKDGESFSEYVSRFDDEGITSDKVLDGLDTYVSESGETHDPKEIRKAIQDVEKKIADGEETINKYRVSGKRDSAVYTDERRNVHKEIISKLLEGKQKSENPTFVLLGGRGGSGKSKFKGEVYDEKDFVVLDADKIKEMLPEYDGWNAAHLHEESADILEAALKTAKDKGLNVVLDATMNGLNSTKRRLDLFKNSGYHTEMHYMFLPRQKAARRAITRFVDRKQGRYVPIDKILDMKDNEKNFQELTKYVDSYSFSNNDVPFGNMPVLVEKKGDMYYNKGGKKWM